MIGFVVSKRTISFTLRILRQIDANAIGDFENYPRVSEKAIMELFVDFVAPIKIVMLY